LAVGDATWWEALISLGLMALTAAVIIAAGARVYQGALLRTGAKAKWREAWTASA
jgi:ABC-2 type transport system permease protein